MRNKRQYKQAWFYVFILVLGIGVSGIGQTKAPNFAVTTSTGKSIALYDSLLNQGNAVVIKMFFTTCPFCQEISPLFQRFYEEWGGGKYGMEAISITIRANDDNNLVNAYKTTYKETFPGISREGGANDVVLSYARAYGSILSTPAFYVIGANGSIIKNPKGLTNEATIDSLEQALISLGHVKPALPWTLPATITRFDGSPLKDRRIRMKGQNGSFLTDSLGNTHITPNLTAATRHQITLQMANDFTTISVLDAVKIQKHLLGTSRFTKHFEYLAADANTDGQVSISDLIRVRKWILDIGGEREKHPGWLFFNKSFTFGPILNLRNETDSAQEVYFNSREWNYERPFEWVAILPGDIF